MTESAVGFMLRHILEHLERGDEVNRPLVVGVQGPQGSGKTFLTTILKDELISSPQDLSVALISLDDLYLPHSELVRVADSHPHNPFLQGRGLPGTHDVPLGTKILNSLRINEHDSQGTVSIPIFDKSLHSGSGDRIERTTVFDRPLDVIIVEGWCTGFYPIPAGTIEERYASSGSPSSPSFVSRKEDVYEINELLRPYADWWSAFDTLIQLSLSDTSSYGLVYKWRTKVQNGGKGMTSDQVQSFVDRYIPGYIFFGDTVENGYIDQHRQQVPPPWRGNALRILIGAEREVVGSVIF